MRHENTVDLHKTKVKLFKMALNGKFKDVNTVDTIFKDLNKTK